jgi:hypothetical protein
MSLDTILFAKLQEVIIPELSAIISPKALYFPSSLIVYFCFLNLKFNKSFRLMLQEVIPNLPGIIINEAPPLERVHTGLKIFECT